jgi:hypothetical protein
MLEMAQHAAAHARLAAEHALVSRRVGRRETELSQRLSSASERQFIYVEPIPRSWTPGFHRPQPPPAFESELEGADAGSRGVQQKCELIAGQEWMARKQRNECRFLSSLTR